MDGILIALVLAILWGSVTSSKELSLETTPGVLLALRHHFQADCLAVVTTGILHNRAMTTRVIKVTSRQGVATALLDAATLFETSERSRHCLRPLHLLLCDGEVRDQLIQLASSVRLSDATWLLFNDDVTGPVEDLFTGVDVPFDCEFLLGKSSDGVVFLTEVYRVSSTWPLRSERFGSWSADKGLTAPQGGLYTRRVSLHGLTLRATNVHDPPLSSVTVLYGRLRPGGFCGNVWDLLEKPMNFTTVHVLPKEGGNRWTEMVNQVLMGEVDATATCVVHTLEREPLVDFTVPLATIPNRIFIAEPTRREVEWSDFLSPFSLSLWLALLGSTLTAAALLALMYHVIRRVAQAGEDAYPLSDAVFLVFGSIFCQQGHAQSPRTLPCRIVHMVTFLVGIIVLNAYSGSMISNLTIFTHPLPFETLEGISEDKDYAFGTTNQSLSHLQMKNATSGVLKVLYDTHIKERPQNLPATNLQAFQQVCGSNFAFIMIPEVLTTLRDQVNCTVVTIPQRFSTYSISLTFKKRSPYSGLFNYNLLRLQSGGVLGLLHKKALDEHPYSPEDDVTPINLAAVTPMLSVVAFGICFALFAFAVELLTMRLLTSTEAQLARASCNKLKRDHEKIVDYVSLEFQYIH